MKSVLCDRIEGEKKYDRIPQTAYVVNTPPKIHLTRLINLGNIQSNTIIPADEYRYRNLIYREPYALRLSLLHRAAVASVTGISTTYDIIHAISALSHEVSTLNPSALNLLKRTSIIWTFLPLRLAVVPPNSR